MIQPEANLGVGELDSLHRPAPVPLRPPDRPGKLPSMPPLVKSSKVQSGLSAGVFRESLQAAYAYRTALIHDERAPQNWARLKEQQWIEAAAGAFTRQLSVAGYQILQSLEGCTFNP